MAGFAYIPSGAHGQCQNTISFTGASSQASYGINLSDGRDGPFSLSANPDIVAWSPCGGSTAILNMNTQCWISPTEKQALIAVCGEGSRTERNRADRRPGRPYQQQTHHPCRPSMEELLSPEDKAEFWPCQGLCKTCFIPRLLSAFLSFFQGSLCSENGFPLNTKVS
jgi:hypothetical protein